MNIPLHGQASQPARTEVFCLASVTPTSDTNADERSSTGQREGEGAGFGRDVCAGVGDADVAGGTIHAVIT